MKKHRFVICPLETGFMVDIANALNKIGVSSFYYAFWKDKFYNPENYKSKILDKYFYFVDKSNSAKKKNRLWESRLWQIPEMFVVLFIFIRSIIHCDTFIYIYERGMFFTSHYLKKNREIEFKILKALRKNIIFWCVGSDTRPPYCGASYHLGDSPSSEALYKESLRIFNDVRLSEKYGILIDNSASAHFHAKPYIDFFAIGLPIDSKDERFNSINIEENQDEILIVHAPSNTDVKGTRIVRDVVRELKENGYHIKYEEIIGQSNDVVLRKLKTADIAVDQLYGDTPCAKFAEEASLCGVPVIVGSYIYKDMQKRYDRKVPPTVLCHPDDLLNTVKYLIHHKEERKRLGIEARDFIKNSWDAEKVAERLNRIVDGDIPNDWWVYPQKDGAVSGGGTSWKRTCENIEKIVDCYGMEGLLIPKDYKLFQEYETIYQKIKGEKNANSIF